MLRDCYRLRMFCDLINNNLVGIVSCKKIPNKAVKIFKSRQINLRTDTAVTWLASSEIIWSLIRTNLSLVFVRPERDQQHNSVYWQCFCTADLHSSEHAWSVRVISWVSAAVRADWAEICQFCNKHLGLRSITRANRQQTRQTTQLRRTNTRNTR